MGISAFVTSGLWTVFIVSQPSQLFTDQTSALGVEFTHGAIDNDDVFVGAGGCWGDYDNDGLLDLYVANQIGPNALFRNLGNGRGFIDVASALGVALPNSSSTGALWGDYDNDGDRDLFVMSRGNNVMFRNDGPGGTGGWIFVDVTSTVGVAGRADSRTAGAVYGDYDNDGWLDLYVATHHYPLTKPDVDDASDPSHADYLYHNVEGVDGERIFVDVAPDIFGTATLDLAVAHSAAFLDYDNDSDLDVFVANEFFPEALILLGTQLWRNDGAGISGGWVFTEVSSAAGVYMDEHPMGIAIGDYNNDGWLDMATTDVGPNHLFKNRGAGTFIDAAVSAGVDREFVPDGSNELQFGWGLAFIDYDLDAYEDLYVATGVRLEPGKQFNPLFHNEGNGTFTDVTEESGADLMSSCRCLTVGDFDRDGDPDFYVVTFDHDAHLYRNEQVGGSYLALDLVGSISNRDAIGARVKVTAAGLPPQYRMVQSGSTTNGGHELTLYFGVTGVSQVDTIEIDWPSGLTTLMEDVAVNQRLTIQEVIPVPTAINIIGDGTVASNNISVFTGEAVYDDGATVNITEEAVWSVAPTTYCEFISPGQMRTFGMSPGQTEAVVVMAEYAGLQATLPVDIVDPAEVDINAPTMEITLTGGGNTLTTDEDEIVLTGTAEDNFGIVSLFWSSDRGPQGPCAGISPWSTGPIQLFEGANLIVVTGTDGAGNVGSAQVTVTYTPFMPPPPPINSNEEDPYSSNDNEEAPINDNVYTEPPEPINNNTAPPVMNENDNESVAPIENENSPAAPPRNTTVPACGGFGMLALASTLLGMGLLKNHRSRIL